MSKKKAAWTVMVYLAGDNNLSSECLFALTEMKKARPGDDMKVIAQFDPRDEFLPTHRYEINRNGSGSALFDDIIDEARFNPRTGEVEFKHESARAGVLAKRRREKSRAVKKVLRGANDLSALAYTEEGTTNDTDTGSPVTLYNFLSFCIERYPAQHYLVVLSGHAGGIETDFLLKDESSKRSLTFNELKYVFRELQNDLEGRPVDIVGMDNCLMSMGEICYELRGTVDVVVGCESFSPASGWPYRQILERLRQDFVSHKVRKEHSFVPLAARAMVEEYVNYYAPYWMSGMSVSQSALDVRRVEEFRHRVDKLAVTMKHELEEEDLRSDGLSAFRDSLILAHWEAQSYDGERFVDLYDFCACLEKRWPHGGVANCCREVCRFIAEKFVLKSCFSGAAYQYSYGVSLYFPWAKILPKYQNLDFVQNSHGGGWLSFLKTYSRLTRRRARRDMPHFSFVRQSSSDRMMDDRMMDDRMMDDRMMDDRMMAGEVSRISSMRNPPIVFYPNRCIKEDRQTVKALMRFFAPNEIVKQ